MVVGTHTHTQARALSLALSLSRSLSVLRNDAVQTALWVIESAINENETGCRRFVLGDQGWLRAVLGDHDDASFERARELCTCTLTGIHSQEKQNRKGKGDAEPLAARWKSSAKHIRHIIRRCMKLPLHEERIQSLLGKIGLAARKDKNLVGQA